MLAFCRPICCRNFPRSRELEQHVIIDGNALVGDVPVFDNARACSRLATNPNDVLIVDEDAVFVLGPFVARSRSAPTLDELSRGVEFEHRRRAMRALFCGDEPWAVEKPDMIALVDRDRRHLSHDPSVGKFRRPRFVELECRQRGGRLGRGCGRLRLHSAPTEERQLQRRGCKDYLRHVGILRPKAGAGNTIFSSIYCRPAADHSLDDGTSCRPSTTAPCIGEIVTPAAASCRHTSKFRSLFSVPAVFRCSVLHTWS